MNANRKSEIENRKSFDLLSLGECLVEFNRRDDGDFHATFAGDAFNVLFYASRLGLRTGFISAVGDDLFTLMILEGIERENIDTSHLVRLAGKRNGLYFIELDDNREYTFHFWRENSAATETLLHQDLDELAEFISRSKYFLFTGVGLAILKEPDRLLTLLKNIHGRVQIIFDTNYRARLWKSSGIYRQRFEEILPFVDTLLPTKNDLEAIYPDVEIKELFRQFLGNGPKAIAMKSGARGCAAWYGDQVLEFPALSDVQVVDTTGAGDAFNAGFIYGLTQDKSIEACCELGQKVAAQALMVRGAINKEFDTRMITTDN